MSERSGRIAGRDVVIGTANELVLAILMITSRIYHLRKDFEA